MLRKSPICQRPKESAVSVLFIGKRYYTNRDALVERYGRIFQLPRQWAKNGVPTRLWLLDYHGVRSERGRDGALEICSSPVKRIGWLTQWIRQLAWSRSAGRKCVVIASGDCYIGLLAFVLARVSGARFVFDVYDKYDEFSGFRRPFGWNAFQYLLARADTTLFASRALLESLGSLASKAFLVPNGVDVRRFRPMDQLASRKRLNLPESAVFVGYFGSMEADRGVTDLIAAVHFLRSRGSPVELLLGGRLSPDIDTEQPGIRYVGNVTFLDVPAMLASCDALAVPYRRSTFMDAGASNKIAEALACGRPLVATMTPNLTSNFPDQAAILKDRLAEPGCPQDLARVLALQLECPLVAPMPDGMGWRAIATAAGHSLDLPIGPPTQSRFGCRK